jgi:5-methyltetrahydrofolate--homocysteine methyltransferase
MQDIVEKIALCVAKGKVSRSAWFPPDMKDQDGADEIAVDALKNGIQPDVLLEGCMVGMDRIGKEFGEGKAFVTNLIISGEAMNAVMKHIKPFLESDKVKHKGKFVIGTVSGDLHDIGKNLVSMMLQGAGFEVVDLGTNISAQKFVDAVKEHKPSILGLSALLTTTMPKMEETINALKEAGIRDQVKIMAGGAPVTQDFVNKIGADAYGANAASATEKAKELVS